MRKLFPSIAAVAVFSLAASACGSTTSAKAGAASSKPPGSSTPTGTHSLVGKFTVTPGTCSSATATPSGSYLEMLGNGGTVVKNSFGGCTNPEFTPLSPGTDGGLLTGSYQPNPTPAFSGSTPQADAIIAPANFFGAKFAASTQAVDPQTHMSVPTPSLSSRSGQLSGNLSALDIAYNTAYFNQGSPKPGGTYTGKTAAITGTISCSGAYSITWSSQIAGGAFNNYTGTWHLSGTFIPKTGTAASAVGCS